MFSLTLRRSQIACQSLPHRSFSLVGRAHLTMPGSRRGFGGLPGQLSRLAKTSAICGSVRFVVQDKVLRARLSQHLGNLLLHCGAGVPQKLNQIKIRVEKRRIQIALLRLAPDLLGFLQPIEEKIIDEPSSSSFSRHRD